MSKESVTIPWHDDEKYTVNGIKMVYMKNSVDKGDNYIATYTGLMLESNLRLMGYEVVKPKRMRIIESNSREVTSR
jgi:hypothetical protein